jgi:hypothetical protein
LSQPSQCPLAAVDVVVTTNILHGRGVIKQLMAADACESNKVRKIWLQDDHRILKRYQDIRIEQESEP